MKNFLAAFLILLLPAISFSQSQPYTPDPDPLIQQRLEDWQDLKFGLLMHWGPTANGVSWKAGVFVRRT